MIKNFSEGPEINRLKPLHLTPADQEQFNRLYREAKSYIKSLCTNINCKKYNVSKDILISYFEDKLIYVWNKYKGDYSEYEHLKALIFKSLKTFKNKLLSKAYTKRAQFYDSLQSWDALEYETTHENMFDEDEEVMGIQIKDEDEDEDRRALLGYIDEHLRKKLTLDEYLLLNIELDPPVYFLERMKTPHSKPSSKQLIEFFELPRTKRSAKIISKMRKHIKEILSQVKYEL